MATQSMPIDLTTVDTSRHECVGGQLTERPVPILEHGRLQRRIANLFSFRKIIYKRRTQVWLVDGESQSIAVFLSADTTKSEVFYEGRISVNGTSLVVPLANIFL